MATSGNADFLVDRDDVVKMALQEVGIVREGGTPTATQETEAMLKLQTILKQWMGTADFSPGLKLWTRSRAVLFLSSTQVKYTLGPNAANGTIVSGVDYHDVKFTELSLAAASTDTSIFIPVVANQVGPAASDRLQLETEYTSLGVLSVQSVTTGAETHEVSFSVPISYDAAQGNKVWYWTGANEIENPLIMHSVSLRDRDNFDVPLEPMTFDEYESITSKNEPGTPTRYLFEPGLTDSYMRFDYKPDDIGKTVLLNFSRAVEDIDSATHNFDLPQVWYRPLYYELAIDLCGPKGIPVPAGLVMKRDEALAIARNSTPEETDAQYMHDGM